MRDKSEIMVSSYMKDVERYFPYSKMKKKRALEHIRNEVIEAINDSEDPLYETMGYPEVLAKNFSGNYDWKVENATTTCRLGAFIIDSILTLIIGIFCLGILGVYWFNFFYGDTSYIGKVVLAPNGSGSYSPIDIDMLVIEIPLVVLIITCYYLTFGHTFILESRRSKTIGKKIMGLVVIDTSGIRITKSQAITRNISKLIPGLLVIEMLVRKTNQRFSEVISESKVIQENENEDYHRFISFIIVTMILFIILFLTWKIAELMIIEVAIKRNTLFN